jgi:hypothetical protein
VGISLSEEHHVTDKTAADEKKKLDPTSQEEPDKNVSELFDPVDLDAIYAALENDVEGAVVRARSEARRPPAVGSPG